MWIWRKNGVTYFHFNFYNGASSTEQLQKMKIALSDLNNDTNKTIVLMGGRTYFNNGIHLNTIEFAEDSADESMKNIIARNLEYRENKNIIA